MARVPEGFIGAAGVAANKRGDLNVVSTQGVHERRADQPGRTRDDDLGEVIVLPSFDSGDNYWSERLGD